MRELVGSSRDNLSPKETTTPESRGMDTSRLLPVSAPEFYRTLLDSMTEGVCLATEEGIIVYTNPAENRMFGYAPGELIGKSLAVFSAGSDKEKQQFIADILAQLKVVGRWGGEWQNRHKDGHQFATIARITVVDVDSKPHWLCLQWGATEDKHAEMALQRFNETLEAKITERAAARDSMWQLSKDLFLVVAPDGTLQDINPAVTTLLGYSPADLIGQHFTPYVHPDDVAKTADGIMQAASTPVTNVETRLRSIDGSWRWFSWSAASREGVIYSVGRHITLEKARQVELEQVQEALRQSQKLEAMGQLMGGVAHDFNNLLTPIIGGLDILQRRGLGDARTQRLIAGALQSAERAKMLVQRLLAFARRQPLQPIAVNIAKLVEGMADLVASTSGPRVKVMVETEPHLPPAKADANQIEMAILNLAVNARDAMPDGGVLAISVMSKIAGVGHRLKLKPGRYICLSVTDTGTGMDKATLARAIEPFFSTKGIGKGTGLGLSMVHGLAAQLGGALHLTSRPKLGTHVELWLPVSDQIEQSREQAPSNTLSTVAGTALLVDDEELVRASTADMLADLGYAVVETSSAEDALALLDGGLMPDLLVTDHLMPGMTGTALAQTVQARYRDLPVLIISGYAEVEDISPDLPRLTKPFRQVDLITSLADLMNASRQARARSR